MLMKQWIKYTYHGNVKSHKQGGRYRFVYGNGLMAWINNKQRWDRINPECNIIGTFLVDKKYIFGVKYETTRLDEKNLLWQLKKL